MPPALNPKKKYRVKVKFEFASRTEIGMPSIGSFFFFFYINNAFPPLRYDAPFYWFSASSTNK